MTWTDVVKEDLRHMGVDALREVVFDINRWRKVVLVIKTKDITIIVVLHIYN